MKILPNFLLSSPLRPPPSYPAPFFTASPYVDQIKYRAQEILKEPSRIFRGVLDALSRSISTALVPGHIAKGKRKGDDKESERIDRGGALSEKELRLHGHDPRGAPIASRVDNLMYISLPNTRITFPFRGLPKTFQLTTEITFINFNDLAYTSHGAPCPAPLYRCCATGHVSLNQIPRPMYLRGPCLPTRSVYVQT